MEKITYAEMVEKMTEYFKKGELNRSAVIVFTVDSFDKEYSEEARSYRVWADSKAFNPSALGYSLFGDCLDGKDLGVRLDWYMKRGSKDGWVVDYCYMEEVE